MKFCWVVPHYNHAEEFAQFFPRLVATGIPCIVVDDGSDQHNLSLVESTLGDNDDVHLVHHTRNRGKGAAVMSACHVARTLGYTHIIQIDADGQHEPDDAQRFIVASNAQPDAIISGYPIFDASAPKVRKYGRRVTTFWVMLETFSLQIQDALCGYRVYPLNAMEQLIDQFHIGPRMEFDTDIVVKAVWAGVPLVFVDTTVLYRDGGTSHFHYLRDNLRLIALHARLMGQSVIRVPNRFMRHLRAS